MPIDEQQRRERLEARQQKQNAAGKTQSASTSEEPTPQDSAKDLALAFADGIEIQSAEIQHSASAGAAMGDASIVAMLSAFATRKRKRTAQLKTYMQRMHAQEREQVAGIEITTPGGEELDAFFDAPLPLLDFRNPMANTLPQHAPVSTLPQQQKEVKLADFSHLTNGTNGSAA